MRESDHVIENAVLRTARVVETLRAVSGADGVGYEPASVVAVLNVALERLEAVLGREGAAAEHLVFGTTLDELESVEVIGQPSLYGLALDLMIEFGERTRFDLRIVAAASQAGGCKRRLSLSSPPVLA